ncbi:MAG: DUF2934 domain-containing protein [Gammaproteobacteria bacterium]
MLFWGRRLNILVILNGVYNMAMSNVKITKADEPAAFEEMIAQKEALTECDRNAKIAEMAYFKAEKRGFIPGFEEADWFEAEKEFDLMQQGNPDA